MWLQQHRAPLATPAGPLAPQPPPPPLSRAAPDTLHSPHLRLLLLEAFPIPHLQTPPPPRATPVAFPRSPWLYLSHSALCPHLSFFSASAPVGPDAVPT